MAEETKDVTTASEQPERTFTQSEVNAIIGDRLAQERKKYADYDDLKDKAGKYDASVEESKSDLQKAMEKAESYKKQLEVLQNENKIRSIRDRVAQEKGIPVSLLSGSTEEECTAHADALLAWRGTDHAYPNVKDGGEVTKVSGGSTRDQFADWFNKSIKN